MIIELYRTWSEKIPHSKWLHHTAYLRLAIPSIIPHIDKILWLDCDMVVRKSLKEIFDTNIDHHLALVCQDNIFSYRIKHPHKYKPNGLDFLQWLDSVGLDSSVNYFCSGFLYINAKLWREQNLHQAFEEYVARYFTTITYGDQDILNFVLRDKLKYVSKMWNFIPCIDSDYYPTIPPLEEINILHYAASKPLNPLCTDKFYINEFWKYFFMTPYFIENPAPYIDIIIAQKTNAHNQRIKKLAKNLTCWIPITKWRRGCREKLLMQKDILYALDS